MSGKTYTVKEAADYLGIRVRTLQRLIKAGKISAHKPNPLGSTSPYVIDASEVERFKQLQDSSKTR